MREELEQIAWVQGGLIRRGQALDRGVSAKRFRRQRTAGLWRRLRRSIYVNATVADLVGDDRVGAQALAISAAALRLAGESVGSLESAALLWGIDVLGRFSGVQLTRERRSQGVAAKYPGVVVHHAAIPPGHVTMRRGVVITTAARTVMDIARVRSFRAGVVAADSALRRGLCTREDLIKVGKDCTRWPGVRKARAVAEFADPRSESPLESISRVAFHEQDVPAPRLQEYVTPYDRVDFLWPKQRVIGEADGMLKYRDPEDLRREKERQEILERLGYRIVRWTWDEVFRRPDVVADWVRNALTRR